MLPLLILALTAAPGLDCDHVEERNATVSAAGATLLRVAAAAGELRVIGREGLSEVRVRGRACSSDRDYLSRIRLEAVRAGSDVRVEVEMPERSGWGNFDARLDLVLEVPAALAAEITDSSGDLVVQDLASLRLEDSSGDAEISGIRGELRVDDSSGDLRIRDGGGDVWLRDSSGSLSVDDVQGSVVVDEDSSGDIEIARVRGDVHVREDSSGDIDVARVGGGFTVDRDGSGGIRSREVAGTVRVPERKRR